MGAINPPFVGGGKWETHESSFDRPSARDDEVEIMRGRAIGDIVGNTNSNKRRRSDGEGDAGSDEGNVGNVRRRKGNHGSDFVNSGRGLNHGSKREERRIRSPRSSGAQVRYREGDGGDVDAEGDPDIDAQEEIMDSDGEFSRHLPREYLHSRQEMQPQHGHGQTVSPPLPEILNYPQSHVYSEEFPPPGHQEHDRSLGGVGPRPFPLPAGSSMLRDGTKRNSSTAERPSDPLRLKRTIGERGSPIQRIAFSHVVGGLGFATGDDASMGRRRSVAGITNPHRYASSTHHCPREERSPSDPSYAIPSSLSSLRHQKQLRECPSPLKSRSHSQPQPLHHAGVAYGNLHLRDSQTQRNQDDPIAVGSTSSSHPGSGAVIGSSHQPLAPSYPHPRPYLNSPPPTGGPPNQHLLESRSKMRHKASFHLQPHPPTPPALPGSGQPYAPLPSTSSSSVSGRGFRNVSEGRVGPHDFPSPGGQRSQPSIVKSSPSLIPMNTDTTISPIHTSSPETTKPNQALKSDTTTSIPSMTDGDHSSSSTKRQPRLPGQKSTIQTACLHCRKAKMKCIRNNEQEVCKRCMQANVDCITKERQSGRRPGTKNKPKPPPDENDTPSKPASKRRKTNQQPMDGSRRPEFTPAGVPTPYSSIQGYSPYPENQPIQHPSQHPPVLFPPNYQPGPGDYAHAQGMQAVTHPVGRSQFLHASAPTNQESVAMIQATRHPSIHSQPSPYASRNQFPIPNPPALPPIRSEYHQPNPQGSSPIHERPYPTESDTRINQSQPGGYGLARYGSTSQARVEHGPSRSQVPIHASRPSASHSQVPTEFSVHREGPYSPRSTDRASPSSHRGRKRPKSETGFTTNPMSMVAGTGIEQGNVEDEDGAIRSEGHGGSETASRTGSFGRVSRSGRRLGSGGSSVHQHPSIWSMSLGGVSGASMTNFSSRNTLVSHSQYFGASPGLPPSLHCGPEFDPICIGLLTEAEAQHLFQFFMDHLHPILVVHDRNVHTFNFVRTTSSFLFTTMLAASSKFVESQSALALRLDRHVKTILGRAVGVEGGTSLELVQALLCINPWLDPGAHFSLDQTATVLAWAISKFLDYQRSRDRYIPTSESTAPDGYERSYERTWLTLYVYDRGFALTGGRSCIMQNIPLVMSVSEWAKNPAYSDPFDIQLGAMTSIRRDLPMLLKRLTNTAVPEMNLVEANIDGSAVPPVATQGPRSSPSVIKAAVDEFIASWTSEWLSPSHPSYAYLSLIGQHTTLSILITGLKDHMNHPTEGAMLHQCLLQSVSVCRVAVGYQDQLWFIPNNTLVMICYAATFIMKVHVQFNNNNNSINNQNEFENGMLALVQQTADMLVKLGSTPSHRGGRATIYGEKLKWTLREHLQRRAQNQAAAQVRTTAKGGDISRSVPVGDGAVGVNGASSSVVPSGSFTTTGTTSNIQQPLVDSHLQTRHRHQQQQQQHSPPHRQPQPQEEQPRPPPPPTLDLLVPPMPEFDFTNLSEAQIASYLERGAASLNLYAATGNSSGAAGVGTGTATGAVFRGGGDDVGGGLITGGAGPASGDSSSGQDAFRWLETPHQLGGGLTLWNDFPEMNGLG